MMRLIFAMMACAMMLAAPNPASANCADYGATATLQHRENVRLGCGFKGPRWHTNTGAHAGFCAIAGDGVADRETSVREAMLAKCRRAAGGQGGQDQAGERCRKSGVAEGSGATTSRARGAAQDLLARTRAQYMNRGFTQCRYNDLGCSGRNGARTCFLSVSCCKR